MARIEQGIHSDLAAALAPRRISALEKIGQRDRSIEREPRASEQIAKSPVLLTDVRHNRTSARRLSPADPDSLGLKNQKFGSSCQHPANFSRIGPLSAMVLHC
jgi:hypothetical protein